jgi:hypothetical protein
MTASHLALKLARSHPPGRGACSNVTTPSPVAFEEAPTRAPSRVGAVSAERRGPDPGPRRSPSVLVGLEHLGLLENAGEGRHAKGEPNAWHLTSKGLQVTQPIRAHAHNNREVA